MYSIKNASSDWLKWGGHTHNVLHSDIFGNAESGHISAHRFSTRRSASAALRRLRSLGYKQSLEIVDAPQFPEMDGKSKQVASMFIDE